MSKILFASTNEGKVKEVKEALSNLDFEVLSLVDFSKELHNFDVEEDGETIEENAIIKARAYGDKLHVMTLADDTGLVVDALDGRPGVHSSRYGKNTLERNLRLLDEMKDVPEGKRSARFITVIAFYDPEKDKTKSVTGVMEGKITFELIGEEGFGYDPVFINELGKTNSEISTEEKNNISARGKALRGMVEVLEGSFIYDSGRLNWFERTIGKID